MMMPIILKLILSALLLSAQTADAFSATSPTRASRSSTELWSALRSDDSSSSRRGFLQGVVASTAALSLGSLPSLAEDENTLDSYLYRVLRVREATQQERRLIKSGKFKDIQRANVKLAVKFMIQNYRLSDAVVGASAYLKAANSMKAIDVGQTAIQNLQTILEYFDSGDVENIKVGKSSMAGKEEVVLNGLQAASGNIDLFLNFFPDETVQKIKDQIKAENDLNVKEFDPKLGDIINLPPSTQTLGS